MAQFRNAQESHNHSLKTLDIIHGYDSFLDSIQSVADFGCGTGIDTAWWAQLETRDDPPEPRNYTCVALDKDISRLAPEIKSLKNVIPIADNFETRLLPSPVDLIWCHDSFQYVTNPLETLKLWNKNINVDGMLIIILRQNVGYEYNRLVSRGMNYCYHNYNLMNLIYMLAVNGFDCRDAYALKQDNDPWLHLAVYKSSIAPMDPATTSWYNLAEKELLHPTVIDSLNRHGHVRQEDIVYPWLDKDFYRIK